MIKRLKQTICAFDRRLNDCDWMNRKYHLEHRTIPEIAAIVGCSEKVARKKLHNHRLLGRDKILNVYTGLFHESKHLIMKLLKKRYLGKIEHHIDGVYPKITSRNPLILKEILEEMAELDQDVGVSSGQALGMSRKETYVLGGKFGICLYDYDSQYEERIDWFLREIIRRQDEFLFDECSNPENWFPNRDVALFNRHFFAKRTKVGEPIFFVDVSKATVTYENQTDRWYRSIKKER